MSKATGIKKSRLALILAVAGLGALLALLPVAALLWPFFRAMSGPAVPLTLDELPRAERQAGIEIVILAAGDYRFVPPGGSAEVLVAADLERKAHALAGRDPGQKVYVGGEAGVGYQKVVDTLALLRRAGLDKIAVVAQSREEGR
ncbi:ExbD/TolR family protein [Luteimonas aquatica]|uniref:ExbD/TolR family protein n=1 Tax=Luteimonas aquatica TaxID=450364 RepID=UPI001F57C39C|nr:biopolymer transporter ExbD [Luteimonas aquatica]